MIPHKWRYRHYLKILDGALRDQSRSVLYTPSETTTVYNLSWPISCRMCTSAQNSVGCDFKPTKYRSPMKPSVKVMVVIAAAMLLIAAISSFMLSNILGMEPIVFSVGSITLLIIARAFSGVQSWALFDKEMHAFRDAEGRSQLWQIVSQIGAVLSLIAFFISSISALTDSAVMGSHSLGWLMSSVNLALISIVVSKSISPSPRD